MTFDPKQHLIQLKGKDYLEVKWRLVWFREMHPNGCISTEVMSFDPILVKATIYNADGSILASAHASAKAAAGAVWVGREIEKAETAAIGRALGHAGFGTQFDAESESDYLADTPVERKPSVQALEGNVASKRLPKPTDGRWTQEEQKAFWVKWSANYTKEQILGTLDVASLGAWPNTLEQAETLMNSYAAIF